MTFIEEAKLIYGERIRSFTADLHAHPELSMEEKRTTEKLRTALSELGVTLIDIGMDTGVVALIPGGDGPLVALRADIDGIRQTEDVDRPDCSLYPGLMHGCGHDVHAGSLLGAAMLLMERRQRLTGDVLLIFQPGEETLQGAAAMLEHGLFNRYSPAAIFGLHNLPELPLGTVGVKSGPLMAYKDGFEIAYIGRSGHTSTPHKNIDPTVAIASLILNLQTVVSRNVGPLESAVVTICSIAAGRPFASIVQDAVITGNVRTLDPQVRERVLKRIEVMAHGTADAYGCTARTRLFEITPGVINDQSLLSAAAAAAEAVFGADKVVVPQVNLAAEDFAILSRDIPSFFYFVGSGQADRPAVLWHNSQYSAHPESPVYGAALLAQSVLEAQKLLGAG